MSRVPRMRSVEEVESNLPLIAAWAQQTNCCVDLRNEFENWSLKLPNSAKYPPKDFAKSFQYWVKNGVARGWIARVQPDEMLPDMGHVAEELQGELWLAMRAAGMNAAQYRRWIAPLQIVTGGGAAYVTAPDRMTRDWVRGRFETQLERALGVERMIWRLAA